MRKTIVQLVDDLSGDSLESGDGRTVAFAFDGVAYEIDLSTPNVEKFHDLLAPYIKAARRLQSGGRRGRRPGTTVTTRKWSVGYSEARTWALANGIEVSARGRVSDTVLQAYEDAHR